jgi:quinol-cytochrome oxidoreductase complex cytochrome b subunit
MIDALKNTVNWLSAPPRFFTLTVAAFLVFLFPGEMGPAWLRRLTRPVASIYRPKVGGLLFGVLGVLFVFSCFDPNFALIVLKPDNVPIAAMIFLVAFFVWFGLKEGRRNDSLRTAGQPIVEKSEAGDGKVMVWPDLVYTEFLCMILWTIFLIIWSIYLKAPIEEPANPAKTPNPSKAPWYFLGLQEMLVYYDPWIAGVLLPGLIIVGLCAIPYIDKNPKGNGYFTFKERKVEIAIFLFGFVVLWVWLIIIGTFLRGPNQNFFGPFELWDAHKLVPLINVDLSQIIWVKWMHMSLPRNPIVREIFGLALVAAYFLALPPLLAKRALKGYYEKLGPARYHIMVFLALTMLSLPIKMMLRWTLNMHYVVTVPEIFFNI